MGATESKTVSKSELLLIDSKTLQSYVRSIGSGYAVIADKIVETQLDGRIVLQALKDNWIDECLEEICSSSTILKKKLKNILVDDLVDDGQAKTILHALGDDMFVNTDDTSNDSSASTFFDSSSFFDVPDVALSASDVICSINNKLRCVTSQSYPFPEVRKAAKDKTKRGGNGSASEKKKRKASSKAKKPKENQEKSITVAHATSGTETVTDSTGTDPALDACEYQLTQLILPDPEGAKGADHLPPVSVTTELVIDENGEGYSLANSYMERVRQRSPSLADELLNILRAYSDKSLTVIDLQIRAWELFRDHEDLKQGFAAFLPANQQEMRGTASNACGAARSSDGCAPLGSDDEEFIPQLQPDDEGATAGTTAASPRLGPVQTSLSVVSGPPSPVPDAPTSTEQGDGANKDNAFMSDCGYDATFDITEHSDVSNILDISNIPYSDVSSGSAEPGPELEPTTASSIHNMTLEDAKDNKGYNMQRLRAQNTEPPLDVGSRVEGKWNDGKWYVGTIVKKLDDVTFNLDYDDGDREENVNISRVRAVRPPKTKKRSRSDGTPHDVEVEEILEEIPDDMRLTHDVIEKDMVVESRVSSKSKEWHVVIVLKVEHQGDGLEPRYLLRYTQSVNPSLYNPFTNTIENLRKYCTGKRRRVDAKQHLDDFVFYRPTR